MAEYDLKVDIINEAYEELRISGITVEPSAYENKLALKRLEQMAREFEARNVCVGYNFEDSPDLNSSSGIPTKHKYSFACCLARRLISMHGKGKEPDPMLLQNASAQLSFLHSSTAKVRQIQYPSRQSIGSGNSRRFSKIGNFYQETTRPPNSCETNIMVVGDINDFIEHFDAYLIDGEVISSYVITCDTGLTINSDSNTDTDVLYNITATGNSGTESNELLQVKIVVTTDEGRITTRLIDFSITDIRDIP